MYQVIEQHGFEAVQTGTEQAISLYRDLIRIRAFDERALSLQRQGWMSSYPQFRGQEASQVGAAKALRSQDWLVPTYRSNGLQIARGVPMRDILLFRRGHTEFASDHEIPVFPQTVPIATQLPHAVGLGMAADLQEDDRVVCVYFGDGATSEGDFHEALNFAGVFETPVVFFCENNGWAISRPAHQQTASSTIAQKAEAYGFEGVRVDGNDPIAVKQTVERAIEQAADGEPVLVESLTYRQGAHSTSDDPSRYEHTQQEFPEWRTSDPVERFETYLREGGILNEEKVAAIRSEAASEVDEAVERAESTAAPEPDELFESVYESATPELRRQREWLRSHVDRHGHPEKR